MRKAIIALLILLFLAGSANAIPARTGGAQGVHVANLWVDGNIVTAGTMTAGTTTTTGNIGADQTWAADKDIKFAAGTGEIDLSASTSTTKTSTGDNTIGGDFYIASGKDIRGVGGNSLFDMSMSSGVFLTPTGAVTIGPGAVGITGNVAQTGATTFSTGTGAISLNGATALNGKMTVASGIDIVAAAAGSDIDYSLATTGIFITPGGAVTIGPGAVGMTGTMTLASGKDIVGGASTSDLDFVASSGAFNSPSGTNTIRGATVWAADKGVTVASGTSAFDFSGGSGVFKTSTGAATIGPGAVGISGAVTLAKTLQYSINASTTLDTTLTSSSTKTMYPMDGSAATVTLNLPDATTVPGRMYIISAPVDMASNNIVVASATGHLGANGNGNVHSLTSTDATASLSVISDGTNYVVLSRVGTWT
jgi:hypothetical protein